MSTLPACGSYARMMSLSTVDLPLPLEPTMAVFLPAGISKLTSRSVPAPAATCRCE